MKFSPEFLDSLREALSPSEIIGRAVKLQAKGRGEYMGLCPFHKEKTPSFTVSDDKGFYHCFGCGVHGDIVKFTMENRGLTFTEAVKSLADEAGIALPKLSYEESVAEARAKSIYDAMEMAANWFHTQLTSPLGRPALEYLTKRGLKQTDIEKFKLGYAPDTNSSLRNYLLLQGVTDNLMQAGGLTLHDEGRKDIDRFRGRIMFPIWNASGRVIAFGGRALGDEQMPKYLNSPETEIFKKGNVLYGLNLAKEYARKNNEIIAVEGYMDVIALNMAGIPNAVAPLGTALTENQLKLLWKVAQEPIMCMDGDAAGQRAMARVAENFTSLLEPGLSIRFAVLPKGQDPDDVAKSQGADFLRKLFKNSEPLSEVIWNLESSSLDAKTPEQRALLEKKLGVIANSIKNASVKSYYQNFFKQKLWDNSKFKPSAKNSGLKRSAELANISGEQLSSLERCEYVLVEYIAKHPYLLKEHEIEEEFSRLDFTLKGLDKARVSVLEIFTHNPDLTGEDLHTQLKEQGLLKNAFTAKAPSNNDNIEVAKSGWRYFLALYNLNSFKLEAEKFAIESDQENYDGRLGEFKKQMVMLEKLAEQEKESFEMALENQ